MESELLVSRVDSVLTLTINRPSRRNALSPHVMTELTEQFRRSREDVGLRVIVLTAVGDHAFCAGADLGTGTSFMFDYSEPRLPLPELYRHARNTNVPIIGRVNGSCMAGGMGLLAVCDLAVAADHALFGLPEVKVGVYPMMVYAALQHVVPRRRLLQMSLTGEPVRASEALEMGLVSTVVPKEELDDAVSALIDRIVDKSPTAIRRGKYASYAIEAMSFEESLAFMEGQIGLLAMTQDATEGQAAFREKRPPKWTGR
jgi:enoyl-CoA hydratase/carnithine racemase